MTRSPRCAARSWRYIARFTAVALFAINTTAHGATTPRQGRTFGGRTAQRDPFVLALSRTRRAIDHAVLWVDADCDDGDDITYSANAALRGAVDAKGRIRAKGSAIRDYGDAIGSVAERLTGHVGARRADGTLWVTVTLIDRVTQQPRTICRSGRVRWAARNRPGTIFAGATDQSDPVVLELSADRTRVAAFRIAWESGCSPAGRYEGSDDLPGGALRDGAFTATLSDRRVYDDGSQTTYHYAVGGQVGRGQAHGTFTAAVTSLNPLGATAWTCDAGPITWRAVA